MNKSSSPSVLYELLSGKFMTGVPSSEWWVTDRGLDWPAPKDAIFERMVGAVLVQNTSWHNNANRAIENIRNLGILEPIAMLKTDSEILRNAIRPAGFMDRKLEVLRGIAELMTKTGIDKMDTPSLKQALLGIRGIGHETSDVILLYAFGRSVMPVSTPARRILKRFCGLDIKDYMGLQKYLENSLPKDVNTYRTFHALLVEFGLNSCLKTKPKCDGCVINENCNSC